MIDDVTARLETVSPVRAGYSNAHGRLANVEGTYAMNCCHLENRPLTEGVVHDLGDLGTGDSSVCLILETAHIHPAR